MVATIDDGGRGEGAGLLAYRIRRLDWLSSPFVPWKDGLAVVRCLGRGAGLAAAAFQEEPASGRLAEGASTHGVHSRGKGFG